MVRVPDGTLKHIKSSPLLEPSERERSDVADLDRHLSHKKSWADSRILPPMPDAIGFKRAVSFNEAKVRLQSDDLEEVRRLRQPGGFRRAHLDKRADENGTPNSERSRKLRIGLVQLLIEGSYDMLDLEMYEHQFGREDSFRDVEEPHLQTKHKLSGIGLVFTIFKSSMGSGVLFQPRAWKSGGYMLSTAILPVVAAASIFASLRLIQVRQSGIRGSYGDLMHMAVGPVGCMASNVSIFLLNAGSCCTYLALIAETLHVTLLPNVPVLILMAGGLLLVTPLTLVRKISKLRYVSLIGTVFTLVGVVFIISCESWHLRTVGAAASIKPINSEGFLVFLGMVCFTFEGISLVLPVYDNVADPTKYPFVYSCTMISTTAINLSVALLGYLAYGEETDNVILVNLPQSIAISLVKLSYTAAIVCTFPLALLPVFNMMEGVIFGPPISKPPFTKKCKKNVFRVVFVIALALVTFGGLSSLDHFVGIVGAFCGLPLAFVYPAIIHLVLSQRLSHRDKILDVMLICFGLVLSVVITSHCILTWGS